MSCKLENYESLHLVVHLTSYDVTTQFTQNRTVKCAH